MIHRLLDAFHGAVTIRYCNEQLLPGSKIEVTGSELYQARCGIVHNFSTESLRGVKDGERRVMYAVGESRSDNLNEMAARANMKGYVAVQLEDLKESVFYAVGSTLCQFPIAPEMKDRARKWVLHLSKDDASEMLERVRRLTNDV